jgi:hypothetical protein
MYPPQDNNDSTFGGFFLGVIFTIGVATLLSHVTESKCQKENNIADCEWVSVPVEQEGTGQSVIYQR